MRWHRIIPFLGIIILFLGCIGVSPAGEKPEIEVGEGKVKVKVPAPSVVLPKEDVIGEDLSDVPRYSPSVRVSYNKDTSYGVVFVSIEYYTEDELSKVRSFYLEEMPKHGWKAIAEEAQPGISLPFGTPFGGVSVGESRTIDFRKEGCADPSTCLPYAKITLGSFEVGGESYTYIGIDYEARAEVEAPSETAPPETAPPKPVTPASDFGKELDSFLKGVLESALGTEATLTSYGETDLGGGVLMVMLEYTLGEPVADLSSAAGAVKSELTKRGAPYASVSVSDTEAAINAGGGEWITKGEATEEKALKFAGKYIGMLTITLYKDSSTVSVSVQAAGGG